MNRLLPLCLLCTLPVSAATIRGRVTILDRSGDAVDPSGAVVWLEGAPGNSAAPGKFEIAMRGKQFRPQVLAVPVGATVRFPNADSILHNVFSASGANRFDLGLYGQGAGRDVVLREAGVVRIYCNVHPGMAAFVVVCPSAHFASVAADGAFRIDGAPAGSYAVTVWDERGGTRSLPVEARGEETVEVAFSLDARSYRRQPHLDKNGKPYAARDEKDPY
ncbi:MAG TPA: hypothetical protein VJS92_18265 [Candidatus Polarisedimenticolaceae bacterium]|nr:hypothetical protein [Candidatus Polarisedimenticolaceae bacterium]